MGYPGSSGRYGTERILQIPCERGRGRGTPMCCRIPSTSRRGYNANTQDMMLCKWEKSCRQIEVAQRRVVTRIRNRNRPWIGTKHNTNKHAVRLTAMSTSAPCHAPASGKLPVCVRLLGHALCAVRAVPVPVFLLPAAPMLQVAPTSKQLLL